MQQLVKPPRRSAARTRKTRQHAKWTTRKESRPPRFKRKENYAGPYDGQPKHEHTQTSID